MMYQRQEACTVMDDEGDGMREMGVLLSTDGPLNNVIKIKPPMVLSEEDIDDSLAKLDTLLSKF